jgi:coatomer protein complex subunit alpha (xenin)
MMSHFLTFQACDKTPTDEYKLEYDEFNPFDICAATYKPIYRGQEKEDCPFCQAKYQKSYKDTVCRICKVGLVGKSVQGIKIRRKIR